MKQTTFPVFLLPAFFCLCIFIVNITPAFAQLAEDRCGTVPYNDQLQLKSGIQPDAKKSRFESWISSQKEKTVKDALRTLGTQQDLEVLQIPVVVHVIHRGEAVGEGTNIPLEQIKEQIRILNEDFRRQNADTVATLPIFEPVAADIMIEFVLAKQTPDGFVTNGVTRTEGNQLSYGINSAGTLSELSYWAAENYFNIWVAPLRNGYLGFAQFPVSDLEGLEDASNNRETDGIVIDYRYFGSGGNAVSGSLGRTTTHEVGHFLGLRHIWGDGDCSADDFVEDTPLQSSESDGCPIDPISCGSPDMYQNYMDYTDDVCMNLFTQNQKERMRIVLLNSPRRASLLTSPALQPPQMADNDAGIEQIISPRQSECSGQLTPSLEVFNAGSNTINSLSIQLFLQGNFVTELQANTSLQTGESTILDFTSLELGPNVNPYELSFLISEVNNMEDENALNNLSSVNFIVPQSASLPLHEDFEEINESSLINTGIIKNDDDLTTWSLTEAPGFDGPDNQAVYLNYYDYDSGIGEKDYFYTPVYDLNGIREAQLSFRYAYATYEEDNEVKEDGLLVGISIDCGATIEEVLFEASGSELATVSPSSTPFVPESRAEWRNLNFSLDDYQGENNVQLVFIGTNDYGNNLYLDDIHLRVEEANALDIAITEISSPAYLSCNPSPTPTIEVVNQGTSTINSFELSYQVDGQELTSFVYDAFPLNPGDREIFTLEQLSLDVGLHTLSVNIFNPNLASDEEPSDNQIDFDFYVDDKTDIVPLVQEFGDINVLADVLTGESSAPDNAWQVVNPDGERSWNLTNTQGLGLSNLSAYIDLYQYQNIGAQDMLVSPTLDFTTVDEVSVFFKISYALLSESYADTLRLLVSTDCGQSYQTAYERAGADLAITTSTEAWVPQQEADWRQEFVNLSDYAGMADVRIAFEVVNAYGNNLYLDDIEFYISADDQPVARKLDENSYRVFPNPYNSVSSVENDGLLKVAFNLRERDDVTILLMDSQGKLLSNQLYPYTLNQTYEFDLSSLPSGMYIIKVLSNSINTTNKVLKE
ncbi:hypothetical protein OKW21_002075 [Catalinimonas alkaloidigena]|uniref:T9SS-dependent choice-of-anchor J family protein n=1 Tax=Catalinimonas alkaloidigena TaxID=1075417 RepID=UPI002406758E|nr:choice-of-anchor J domain-containing protein [Catalinimonas alkaloidigena]MDF9796812.1 hypothetical protein [Catalinimonas alkaloidigena]